MNKKGFTLIEVIICLVIIIIIGTTTTIALIKKEDTKLEKINDKIKDAVNVYITIEKDEDGDTYLQGIQKGGKGVVISLQNLVDKGYLDQSIITTLIDEGKVESELKLLASNSVYENNSNECGTDFVEITFQWDTNSNEPIYLCPKDANTVGEIKDSESIYNKILSNNYKTECTQSDDNSSINHHTNSISGLCYLKRIDEDGSFYYKGVVNNNYVKIEGLDGKEFRIVRTVENGDIKIIEANTLDSTMKYENTSDMRDLSAGDADKNEYKICNRFKEEECNLTNPNKINCVNRNLVLKKCNDLQVKFGAFINVNCKIWSELETNSNPDDRLEVCIKDLDKVTLAIDLRATSSGNLRILEENYDIISWDDSDISWDDSAIDMSIKAGKSMLDGFYIGVNVKDTLSEVISNKQLSNNKLRPGDCYDDITDKSVDKPYPCSNMKQSIKDDINNSLDEYLKSDPNNDYKVRLENPLYKFIYKPLYDNYNTIEDKIKNYIVEYNWEINDKNCKDNTCVKSKSISSAFGLLSSEEYRMISNRNKVGSGYDTSYYGYNIGQEPKSNSTKEKNIVEFSMDFEPTMDIFGLSQRMTGFGGTDIYLRPAYVIKGNSKVVDGDGTESNPYVIDGLTN